MFSDCRKEKMQRVGEGARIAFSSSYSSSMSSSRLAFSTSSSSLSSPFLTEDLTSQESRARCLARISKMKPLRAADGPVGGEKKEKNLNLLVAGETGGCGACCSC